MIAELIMTILPIYTYGQDVLRTESKEITKEYPHLEQLIGNMYETMYNADGVGISACQVGIPIRLFVIDVSDFYDDEELAKVGEGAQKERFKRVFINPEILEFSQAEEPYREGCLSVPGINENVIRPVAIKLRYLDENFVEHTELFDTMFARVIQHEYDHLNGELFSDHVAPIRKQMLRSKLAAMSKGNFKASYRCK